MADQQPQDQPKPLSGEAQRDWNEVSAEEIEQTLSNATELAYELAGDMGVAGNQPRFRDTPELQAIETALDSELKQIDHLVSKTQEELGESPPTATANAAESDGTSTPAKPALSVPDFMAEFMTDEPITVFPASSHSDRVAGEKAAAAASPTDANAQAVPGLVGVGTLRQRKTRKPHKPERHVASNRPDHVPQQSIWARILGKPAFQVCQVGVTMLEILDRPLSNLNPNVRRALHVIALAAFCVCLVMFVLSLMFS